MSSLPQSQLSPSSPRVRAAELQPIPLPAASDWNDGRVVAIRFREPGQGGLAAKRALDVVLALVAIVLLSPLLIVLAAAVAISSPGSPLFSQVRIGRNGRPFRCWKFRSMYPDAETRLREDDDLWEAYVSNDFKLNCDEDPRVTPLGRLLRRSSLDELPQLFNVLLGHMSLVGPRPVVGEELACYGPWVSAYLSVRPGLTGPWQVSGRNAVRYPERAILDARYVVTWSFWSDVRIMARTPSALIRKIGVD